VESEIAVAYSLVKATEPSALTVAVSAPSRGLYALIVASYMPNRRDVSATLERVGLLPPGNER
jgi:hypothetical protein